MKCNRSKAWLAILLVVSLLLPIIADSNLTQALNTDILEAKPITEEDEYIGSERIDDNENAVMPEISIEELTGETQILQYIDESVFARRGHIARLPERETLSSYAFLNNDGTATVYYMDKDVKFIDSSGRIVEKNIQLINAKNGFSTASNNIDALFPNDPADGIQIAYGGYNIAMIPEGGQLQKTAQKNEESVCYPDYFGENASLVYTPLLDGLKEDIVLDCYTGVNTFTFRLLTDGLRPYQENGRFYLAKSADAETRINLGEVVSFDAKGRFSLGNTDIRVIKPSQEYRLTITVDEEFLKAESTAYPVSIDPTITISDTTYGAGAIEDITVYTGRPNANCNWTYLHCGYYDDTYKVARTLFRLQGLIQDDIYNSLSAADINSVEFHIREASGNPALPIYLYSNFGSASWTETGATWSNAGHICGDRYAIVSPASNSDTVFNITALVRAWKNNTASAAAGFILKSSDETSIDKAFYSSEYGTSSYRPYVVVNYNISSLSATVCENATQALSADGISGTITWSSDNTSVATVSSTGVVTGIKAGQATITASVSGQVRRQYTVYVVLANGVYYLKNNMSALYLSAQDSDVKAGTLLTQESKRTASPTRFSQLWKITHLGGGKYSIRPMHKLDRGIGVSGSNAALSTVNEDDSLALIGASNRWTISYSSSGYVIRQNGAADKTLAPQGLSSTAYTTMAFTNPTTLSNGHRWTLENVTSSVGNQIIFYDGRAKELTINATRHVAPRGGATCDSMDLFASFVSRYTNRQNIAWTSNDESVVKVLEVSGDVTGVTPYSFTTIEAAVVYDGVEYSRTYGMYVTAVPEGVYYLRNKETEKYADIYNSAMTTGAVICQSDFDGANTQKWIITHLGDGTYTIKSANSTSAMYMGVHGSSPAPNASVMLRTGTVVSGMRWRIIQASDGAYRIIPQCGENEGWVWAVNEDSIIGNNAPIQQRSYTNDTDYRDEWLVYQHRDYSLMFMGYEEGDPDMPGILWVVEHAFNSNPSILNGYAETSMTKLEIQEHLSSSKVFACITHGSETSITISNGSYTLGDVNALSADAFSNLRFVYLGACDTAKGGSDADNLVNALYSKGADTVLGFKHEVEVYETNVWTEEFMRSIAAGNTIDDALADADFWLDSNVLLPLDGYEYTVSEAYRYSIGPTNIAPCA